MLYSKYSSNRIFFLNEYWILIPSAVLVNYIILGKIRSDKEKVKLLKENLELLKKLENQLKREQTIRRIFYLSLGLNGYLYLLIRGGGNGINVDYILNMQWNIEKSLRYLDAERLRRIIYDLYRDKRRGKVIYIIATAVCHLANQYGQNFLALPIAVGDFGLTNLYQTVRKVFATVLLGSVGPLWVAGGPVALVSAFALAVVGLRVALNNLDFIPTSPVVETGSPKNLPPRILGSPDVVVFNSRDKLVMTNPLEGKKECWFPDQALLNSNCKPKALEIPTAGDLVSPSLKYDEVVNMQDVTGLDRVEFTDKFDLGTTEPI